MEITVYVAPKCEIIELAVEDAILQASLDDLKKGETIGDY